MKNFHFKYTLKAFNSKFKMFHLISLMFPSKFTRLCLVLLIPSLPLCTSQLYYNPQLSCVPGSREISIINNICMSLQSQKLDFIQHSEKQTYQQGQCEPTGALIQVLARRVTVCVSVFCLVQRNKGIKEFSSRDVSMNEGFCFKIQLSVLKSFIKISYSTIHSSQRSSGEDVKIR